MLGTVLSVLAVGLTGCSGGGDGGGSDDGGSADGTDGTDAQGEKPLGALDAMFQAAWEDANGQDEAGQYAELEELVAECMAEQGFEYIPVVLPAEMFEASSEGEDDIAWGTLEFAQQWGYAITTGPSPESSEPSPSPEVVDPNEAITGAMSETELEAYHAALWGEPAEPAEGEEYVEPTAEQLGCQAAAQQEGIGGGAGGDDPFADLMDEMNRMWDSVSTDDRVLAVEARWASCMADAGHPELARIGDGENLIYELAEPIWDEAYAEMPVDATEEDVRAFEASLDERLAAITPQEIEIAVADIGCRDDVRYDDVYAEVDRDLQQQFYDAHRAELEEWVAYQQEQQG